MCYITMCLVDSTKCLFQATSDIKWTPHSSQLGPSLLFLSCKYEIKVSSKQRKYLKFLEQGILPPSPSLGLPENSHGISPNCTRFPLSSESPKLTQISQNSHKWEFVCFFKLPPTHPNFPGFHKLPLMPPNSPGYKTYLHVNQLIVCIKKTWYDTL